MLPQVIQTNQHGEMLFGISSFVNMVLEDSKDSYLAVEPSGIIRQGVSIEFYKRYQHLFIVIK